MGRRGPSIHGYRSLYPFSAQDAQVPQQVEVLSYERLLLLPGLRRMVEVGVLLGRVMPSSAAVLMTPD